MKLLPASFILSEGTAVHKPTAVIVPRCIHTQWRQVGKPAATTSYRLSRSGHSQTVQGGLGFPCRESPRRPLGHHLQQPPRRGVAEPFQHFDSANEPELLGGEGSTGQLVQNGVHALARFERQLRGERFLQGRQCLFADFQEVRDRKSTRLNSSHVRISYAVFCL